jgi:hypothetical protein
MLDSSAIVAWRILILRQAQDEVYGIVLKQVPHAELVEA